MQGIRYLTINQCNPPYKHAKEEKNIHINWCRKSIWQNLTITHDKNSQNIRIKRNFLILIKSMYKLSLSFYLMVKDWTKVRMSTLITLIQPNASSFRQCKKAIPENKRPPGCKGINKITAIAVVMIFYIKNPKKSAKNS